jgi:HAD superfamily hydrolase (TIGR01549 family)
MKARIRAVVFDVDGTLYHQAPVRALMASELAAHAAVGGRQARRLIRALRTFRLVREELRELGAPAASLADIQFERAAERIGESPIFIRQSVEEWMFRRPVKYVRCARRRPVASLLSRLRQQGVPLGVLSDYPAEAKLNGLGLSGVFSIVACTTDPAINAFKPHPRGFLHVCGLLGLNACDVAYVGDRADVDADGARAAGMPCYLVGRHAARHDHKEGWDGIHRLEDLSRIGLSVA